MHSSDLKGRLLSTLRPSLPALESRPGRDWVSLRYELSHSTGAGLAVAQLSAQRSWGSRIRAGVGLDTKSAPWVRLTLTCRRQYCCRRSEVPSSMGDFRSTLIVIAICVPAITILLSMKGRREAFTFLVGASAGLFAVQLFNVHVFTVLLIIWAFSSPREVTGRAIGSASAIIAAAGLLAVTALTGDLVNSPTLGLQLMAMAISAGLVILKSTPRDTQLMLFGLLATCSAASLWAVLQVAGIAPGELFHIDVSATGRPNGFYPEPDWMGMFAGIGLVLAWRLPLRTLLRVCLFSVNGLAFAFAFARAAWVAVGASIIAVIVVVWITEGRTSSDGSGTRPAVRSGRLRALLAFVGAGAVAIALLPSLANDLLVRLSRTLVANASDISAQARVQQNDSLAFLAQSAPWYGHGLSTSGRVGVSGLIEYGDSRNNVGSNWLVSMWVDGAWLSLALIAVLVGVALFSVKLIPGQILLIVLLNSLFSNVTYQPVTWLALGLASATLLQSHEERVQRPQRIRDRGQHVKRVRAQATSPGAVSTILSGGTAAQR
jgi:hypothetical protein